MGLEKLFPISGFVKSYGELKALKNMPDNQNIASGFKYDVKRFEVIGVGVLNLAYAAVTCYLLSKLNG